MTITTKWTPASVKTDSFVATPSIKQSDNIGEMRELLTQYKSGLVTVHELVMRVHAETGYTVQTLSADSMTLVFNHETRLGDVVSTITVDLL